ncbi:hypothetical protein BVRB_2g025220 [Beta vulgaris subsp. vulgaris]|nr:hypothetical protein BVRB_2g025220 [Beta vulgaris subsp. vulgaris]
MADGTLCITDKKHLIQKPLYYMLITAQVYLKSFSLCVLLFRRDSSFLDAVYNSHCTSLSKCARTPFFVFNMASLCAIAPTRRKKKA